MSADSHDVRAEQERDARNGRLSDDILVALYATILESIRFTDRTSFQLLRTIPLVSGVGSGVLALSQLDELLGSHTEPVVLALAAVGALLTFDLFRWEMRNVQQCERLVGLAAQPEERLLGIRTPPETESPWRRPGTWGKTESEKLIYVTAILAWAIPTLLAGLSLWSSSATRLPSGSMG